eukprot:Gb_27006 [translate_table: standard]
MSSKFPVAGGIAERRVRPLWDAIDTRQYKTALKLATALLAKHPDSPYILALKALVLERMGKPDEALPLCLNAKDAGPVDDLTLSTLQIVFQRLDRLDLATSCYKYACGKIPNNLELMMGLFNCYVREYSYVKQQQIAMNMYNLVGEERFLLWAVCSIQLQVSCGNGDKILLSLAEALLKRHIESHGLHELEALLVYISVLEQQAKFEAALDVLAGKLGGLFSIENDRLRIQGKLLIRTHEYADAANILQKVLETCSDDWEIFLQYLDCLLEDDSAGHKKTINTEDHFQPGIRSDACTSTSLTEEEFDLRISNVRSFIQKLQNKEVHDVRRGPFLANLELEKRRHIFGKANTEELIQAILEYFRRFGNLASFASDIEEFLRFVDPGQRPKLLDKLHETCSQLSPGDLVKGLGRTIAIFQVEERFDRTFAASNDELVAHAISLARLYLTNLHLSKDLDPQESMHGEELLSMASNDLIQLFWRTQHLGYLLEAILVLEFGLSIRRYIWQYRVMLIHMYTHWVAIPLAFEWYKTLDIKNIMLESMSHHIFPHLLSSPLWSELNNFMKEYLRFHEDHMKETADLTFLVYRHCNYSKVLEFVKFRERLQKSYHYLLVRIETAILQLKQKANNLEEAEYILTNLNYGIQTLEWSDEQYLNSLSFNEDLQTRPWWSPAPDECYLSGPFELGVGRRKEISEHQHSREKQLRMALQRRCLLPRLIQLSLQCVSFLKDMEEGKTHDKEGCRAELKQMLERYAGTLGFSFDEAVGVLTKIISNEKSFKELKLDLVDWISLAVFYNAWKLPGECYVSVSTEKCSSSSSSIVVKLMELSVRELVESAAFCQPRTVKCLVKVIPPGPAMATLLQLVTESFAWHGLILQSCVRSLHPAGKKKRRSVLTGSHGGSSSSIFDVIQTSIASFSSIIENVVCWLAGYQDKSEDQELDLLLSLLEARQEPDASLEGKVSAIPGCVLKVLERSSTMVSDLGPRIGQTVQTWSASAFVRKLVSSQHMVVSGLQHVCTFQLKSLKSLKQSI